MTQTASPVTARKRGQHGASLKSRRTLEEVRRILVAQALGGNPTACAEVLRLADDLGVDDGVSDAA